MINIILCGTNYHIWLCIDLF